MPVRAASEREPAARTEGTLRRSITLNIAAISGLDRTAEVGSLFRDSGISGRALMEKISDFAEHAGRWEQHVIEGRAGEADAERLLSISERAAAEFGIIIIIGDIFQTESGRYANFAIINNAYVPERLDWEERQFLMDAMLVAENQVATGPERANEINNMVIAYIKACAWLETLEGTPSTIPEMPGWTGAIEGIFPDPAQMPEQQRRIFEGFSERGFRAVMDEARSMIAEHLAEAVSHLRNGLEQIISGTEGEWAFNQANSILGQAMDIQNFLNFVEAYAGRINSVRQSWQGLSRMNAFQGVSSPELLSGLIARRDQAVELQANAQWHLTRAFFLMAAGREEDAVREEAAAETALERARIAIDGLNSAYVSAQRRGGLARVYMEAAEGLAALQFEGVVGRQARAFLERRRDALVSDLRNAAEIGTELEGVEERVAEIDRMHANAAEYEAFVNGLRNSIFSATAGIRSGMNEGVRRLAQLWKGEGFAEMLQQLPEGERIAREFSESDAELGEWRMGNIRTIAIRETEVGRICDSLIFSYSPERIVVNAGAANLSEKFGFGSNPSFERLMEMVGELGEDADIISTTISGRAFWMERELRAAIPPDVYSLPGVAATETVLAARIDALTAANVVGAMPVMGMAAGAIWKGLGAAFATRTGAALLEYTQAAFMGWGSYELSTGVYGYVTASTEEERRAALDHMRDGAMLIGLPATRLAGMPSFLNRALVASAPFVRATAFATAGVVLTHDIVRWSREGVEPFTLAMDIFAVSVPAWGLRGVFRELLPRAAGGRDLALATEGAGGRVAGRMRIPEPGTVPRRNMAFEVGEVEGAGGISLAEQERSLEMLRRLGISDDAAREMARVIPNQELQNRVGLIEGMFSDARVVEFQSAVLRTRPGLLTGTEEEFLNRILKMEINLETINNYLRGQGWRVNQETLRRIGMDYISNPDLLIGRQISRREITLMVEAAQKSAMAELAQNRFDRWISHYSRKPAGIRGGEMSSAEIIATARRMGFSEVPGQTGTHRIYRRTLPNGRVQDFDIPLDKRYGFEFIEERITRGSLRRGTSEGRALTNEFLDATYNREYQSMIDKNVPKWLAEAEAAAGGTGGVR